MSLTVLKIRPSTTNASISSYNHPHTVVYLSQSNYSHVDKKLLIWMPGSFGQPSNQLILQKYAATDLGYFVLGIQYVNGNTIGGLCKKKPSNCYYDARLEVITGQDVSSVLSVSPTDSVLNRVTSLLNYLHENIDPIWGEFLISPTSVNWTKTTVAGHSQGGGNAAVMAQLYPLQRAALFSAPADESDWTSMYAFATPSSQVYGLVHYADSVCHSSVANWKGEGLAGPFVDFLEELRGGGTNQGFGGSHSLCLSSSFSIFDCLYVHGSTAVDWRLKYDSKGVPVVQPAWEYMLGGSNQPPVNEGSTPTCSCHPCLFWMFVAIVGTLIAYLTIPAIVAYLVYRKRYATFVQVFKTLLVVWSVLLIISISLIVTTIAFPMATVLTLSDAMGISGGITGLLTFGLMWWWRGSRWWTCSASSSEMKAIQQVEYQAVSIDDQAPTSLSSSLSVPLNSFVQPSNERSI